MSFVLDPTTEVFSLGEIARAAGVDLAAARALVTARQMDTCRHGYFACPEAVTAVVLLRDGRHSSGGPPALFEAGRPPARGRPPIVPFLASGGLHAVLAVSLAFIAAAGVSSRAEAPAQREQTRLVFFALPGPGGGGGGGGLRQPKPAQPAALKGSRPLRSPVVRRQPEPVRQTRPEAAVTPPPVPRPVEAPVEPPPPAPTPPAPEVVAPVASVAADAEDRRGVLDEAPAQIQSQGPGSGGGSGVGEGTGTGEGSGAGIGPGSGGGTGGGPFRPGSGVTPPRLLREVKPDYTEEARRRGLTGEVVLEVIVRSDGRVGSVRVLEGLGGGLDQRAVDAVRQWRFAPGERLGRPVDVVVEVAVEFRLR